MLLSMNHCGGGLHLTFFFRHGQQSKLAVYAHQRQVICWCRWQHKGKKKKHSDKEDLYALLGLGNERWTANDNQIKLGQSHC